MGEDAMKRDDAREMPTSELLRLVGDMWDHRPLIGEVCRRLESAEAEVERLRAAGDGLLSIVEGIKGAMEHGTWRAERSNIRMKDTEEWVAFYLALKGGAA